MPPTPEKKGRSRRRRGKRRRTGRRDQETRRRLRRAAPAIATGALAVVVVLSPQLFGGAFGWSVAVMAGLAAAACLLAAWAARTNRSSSASDAVVAGSVVGIAWTGLQALPLPRGLTHMLQPEAVVMSDSAARLLGEDPGGWIAVSLAPGETWQALVEGLAIVTCFLAASLLVGLGHRRRVLIVVGASTLLMALVGLSHLVADARSVFGLYEPVYTSSAMLAPLLNNNHLSGFLSMGVPVFVGLGLDAEERKWTGTWLTGAVVLSACALLATSRGGTVSLVVGLAVLAVLVGLRRLPSTSTTKRGALAVVGATGVLGVGLGLYVASEALFRQFEQGDTSKLELALSGLGVAFDHPFIGVGRGAFSAAFVSIEGEHVRFTHPENIVSQWSAEWGLVVAVGILLALATAWLRSVRRARSFAHLGAAAGLVAIAAHDLVDFSLEMPGIAIVAAGAAGAVFTPRPTSRSRAKSSRRKLAWAVGGLGLVIVGASGWQLDGNSVRVLRGELETQLRAGDHEAFAHTLRTATRLHPAEPVFALLGGAEAARRDDPDGIRWLNHAMVLAPGWSAPHDETALWLARHQWIGQAFLEVRAAAERGGRRSHELPCSLLRDRPEETEEFLRATGHDDVGLELMTRVARCLPRGATAGAEIDRVLVERGELGARLRSVRRALQAGEIQRAQELLEPAYDLHDERVAILRAQAFLQSEQPAEAAAVLERAEQWGTPSERMLRLHAKAQVAAEDAEGMRTTLRTLRARASGSAQRLASVWIRQGRLERRLGNDDRAMQAYERAHRLDPDSNGLREVARLANRLHQYQRSYGAYSQLCQRRGRGRNRACAARDRVRERMDEAPSPPSQLEVVP